MINNPILPGFNPIPQFAELKKIITLPLQLLNGSPACKFITPET
jgi:hypothetical protein